MACRITPSMCWPTRRSARRSRRSRTGPRSPGSTSGRLHRGLRHRARNARDKRTCGSTRHPSHRGCIMTDRTATRWAQARAPSEAIFGGQRSSDPCAFLRSGASDPAPSKRKYPDDELHADAYANIENGPVADNPARASAGGLWTETVATASLAAAAAGHDCQASQQNGCGPGRVCRPGSIAPRQRCGIRQAPKNVRFRGKSGNVMG